MIECVGSIDGLSYKREDPTVDIAKQVVQVRNFVTQVTEVNGFVDPKAVFGPWAMDLVDHITAFRRSRIVASADKCETASEDVVAYFACAKTQAEYEEVA